MTKREIVAPSPAAALLELLANPDVGALVMNANDALLRRHFAVLLARLHELREAEVRP